MKFAPVASLVRVRAVRPIGPVLIAIAFVACARKTPEFVPSQSEPAGAAQPLQTAEPEVATSELQPAAPTVVADDAPPRSDLGCPFPNGPPRPRTAGSLTVPSVPGKRSLDIAGRLRSHTDGALSHRAQRKWVGPPVP